MERQRTVAVLRGVVVSESDGGVVGVEQLLLLREFFRQHAGNHLHVDAEQCGQRAGVHDVPQQGAITVADKVLDTELTERNAEDRDPFAHQRRIEWPRRVVHEVSTRAHQRDVACIGGGIERDDEVQRRRSCRVPVLADTDFVERRQALNIRREDVLARHRYTHPEDGLHQQAVGTR